MGFIFWALCPREFGEQPILWVFSILINNLSLLPDFIVNHAVLEYFQGSDFIENLWLIELDKIVDDDVRGPQ